MGMRLNYPPPEDDKEFERLCLALLQLHWECPELQLYGHRGDRQYGIDILDLSGRGQARAAQCKLHDSKKSIPPIEIINEVKKAKTYETPLGLFVIMTTAKVSTKSLDAVLRINREHRAAGLFQVDLMPWERIKDLLEQYPSVADDIYKSLRGKEVVQVEAKLTSIMDSLASQARTTSDDSVEVTLDDAKRFLDNFEYEAARSLLERLRQRSWDRMTNRQKFRTLTNLAAADLAQHKFKEAAKLFLEAKAFQPEDEKALSNESLAYELIGDNERAFSLATAARKIYPLSSSILVAWIRNAPQSMPVADLQKEVPAPLVGEAGLSIALAARALPEKDVILAEGLARQACSAKSDWSYAWLTLGRAILNCELAKAQEDFLALVALADKKRILEAEDCFTKAIRFSQKERQVEIEAEALLNRAEIRQILDDKKGNDEDVGEAYHRLPENATVCREYGRLLLQRRETEAGIQILRAAALNGGREDVEVLLSTALVATGKPEDRREGTDLLAQIARRNTKQPKGFREHVIFSALEGFSKDARWEEANTFLDGLPSGTTSDVALAAFRGKLRLLQGDRDKASESADFALTQVSPDSSNEDLRFLSTLLSDLGRPKDALPIWNRVAPRTYLGNDTRKLLECAARLGRDDIIREVCKTLREAGTHDSELLNLELSVLERYDFDGSVQIMQEHLRTHPEDRVIRFQLSILGARLNRMKLVSGEPSDLPKPEEILSANWPGLIEIMRVSGHTNEALVYAYDLLRKNFVDANAHRAFLHALLPTGPRPDVPEFETAGPGAAVCYVEEGTSTEKWAIIEDSPDPDPGRNELSPSGQTAKNMAGKRKGDRFTLASGIVGDRYAVIKEILSKFVYRYQDCLNEWQVRFPEQPEIEMIRVVKQGSQEIDISPILRSIDRRDEMRKKIEELYRSQPVPLHLFGLPFNRDTFLTIYYMAESPHLSVNCCLGSVEERSEALQRLTSCGTLVIDLTAIATLSLLDRVELLRSWPVPVIVSQGTIAELIRLAAKEAESGAEGGVLTKIDGAYALIEDTPIARATRAEHFKNLTDLLATSCKVVACQELANVDPQKRETLVKAFGSYGAESMVLGTKPGHVLWTDDYIMARFARQEFGVRSVWTQVALQARTEAGTLDPAVFVDASAKLLGWGYFFTSTTVPVLLRAGMLASWDQSARPLKQALNMFSDESIALRDSLRLAAAFMVSYFREIVLPELRKKITAGVLEQLAKRASGLAAIRKLAMALERALPFQPGLEVDRVQELIAVIKAWLKEKQHGLNL